MIKQRQESWCQLLHFYVSEIEMRWGEEPRAASKLQWLILHTGVCWVLFCPITLTTASQAGSATVMSCGWTHVERCAERLHTKICPGWWGVRAQATWLTVCALHACAVLLRKALPTLVFDLKKTELEKKKEKNIVKVQSSYGSVLHIYHQS